MTGKEWQTVYNMSQDKDIYHNVCSSLFPTIHGKRGWGEEGYILRFTVKWGGGGVYIPVPSMGEGGVHP